MRWVLSLWCVFLLSAGTLAQSSARFSVRDAKTRQLQSGLTIRFSQPERVLRTDSTGTVECHGLAPGKHHYVVDSVFDGNKKQKAGTVTLHDGKQTEVRLTVHYPEEVYQLAHSRLWQTSRWMTMEPTWARLVPGPWEQETPSPPQPGKLTLRVRDAITGKPLPYVAILLKGPEIMEPVGEEDTNEEGNAVREMLPGTYSYAVVAFVDGVFYERQHGEVRVTAGKEVEIAIALRVVVPSRGATSRPTPEGRLAAGP